MCVCVCVCVWLIGAQSFGTCYEDGSQRVAGVKLRQANYAHSAHIPFNPAASNIMD